MLAVVHSEHGVVEVNYMWLPSWLGMNSVLMKELGEHLRGKAEGKELSQSTLLELHYELLRYLDEKFPDIKGLSACLQGLQNVVIDGGEESQG